MAENSPSVFIQLKSFDTVNKKRPKQLNKCKEETNESPRQKTYIRAFSYLLAKKFSCLAMFSKKEFAFVSNLRFISKTNFMLS